MVVKIAVLCFTLVIRQSITITSYTYYRRLTVQSTYIGTQHSLKIFVDCLCTPMHMDYILFSFTELSSGVCP